MSDKTKTTVDNSKLNSLPQNANEIQKDAQQRASNAQNLKKDAERATHFKIGKKPQVGVKCCPDGMTWDDDLKKCV